VEYAAGLQPKGTASAPIEKASTMLAECSLLSLRSCRYRQADVRSDQLFFDILLPCYMENNSVYFVVSPTQMVFQEGDTVWLQSLQESTSIILSNTTQPRNQGRHLLPDIAYYTSSTRRPATLHLAVTLADQVDVRHWIHHVRAHNRMADSLANLACIKSPAPKSYILRHEPGTQTSTNSLWMTSAHGWRPR
jgi:hypothetical protein